MLIAADEERPGRWRASFLAWLAAYFAAQVVLRTSAPALVDIDEAEQLVMTQWWQWGYGHQPPLYTWLQICVFEGLGRNVFALSLLKNALIFLTYVVAYGAGLTLMGDRTRATIGALGLFLLPQVAWSSQRDLTHSVLAMCMCAAGFWVFLLLMKRRTWWLYFAFGAVIGFGVLSKYNVVFLVLAMLVGGLFTQQGRAALLRPSILLSMIIAVAIVWPHAMWLSDHTHMLESAAEKAKVATSPSVLVTLGSLALAMLSAVGPLIGVYVVVFGPALRRRVIDNRVAYSGLGFAIAATAIAVAIVVSLDLPHFRARWLQPVVVIAPVLLAAPLDRGALSRARLGVFNAICIAMAVCVLAVMGVRIIGARMAGRIEDYEFPFEQVAREIQSKIGGDPPLIVSDSSLITGNLKHQFPDVPAFLPGVRDDRLISLAQQRGVVVVWERNARERIPVALAPLLERIDSDGDNQWPVQEFNLSSNGISDSPSLAMIVLPPRGAPATAPSSR